MTNAIYLTQEGYNEYLEKIAQAEQHLWQIQNQKGETASQQSDDWRSTSPFSLDEERLLKKRIASLKADLDRVVIIESNHSADIVDVDSIVTIKFVEDDEICKLKLIATPLNDLKNEVSLNCPLGKAIFSRKINEIVTYEVDGIHIEVQILNIE